MKKLELSFFIKDRPKMEKKTRNKKSNQRQLSRGVNDRPKTIKINSITKKANQQI